MTSKNENKARALVAIVAAGKAWQAASITPDAMGPLWATLRGARAAVAERVSVRDVETAWREAGVTLSACSASQVGPMAIAADWESAWLAACDLLAAAGKPEDPTRPWAPIVNAQTKGGVSLADMRKWSDALPKSGKARAKALAVLVTGMRDAAKAGKPKGKGKGGASASEGKGKGKGGAQQSAPVTPSAKIQAATLMFTQLHQRGEYSMTAADLVAARDALNALIRGRNDAVLAGALAKSATTTPADTAPATPVYATPAKRSRKSA